MVENEKHWWWQITNLIFVDFKKVFDVELSAILSALQQCRLDYKYIKLIKLISKTIPSIKFYRSK